MALLVDAGPLVAAGDRSDQNHRACRDLLEQEPGPLLVPMLVVAEVSHLLLARAGARAETLFAIDLAEGGLIAEPVAAADWSRVVELLLRYPDLDLGITDASVVAAAERLGVTRIATLDRRHFGAVRPRHADGFELLP